MADQNIKDFTINWITFGFLFFCLLTFTLTYFYENNPDALGDSQSNFEGYATNMSAELVEIETTSNEQINISALIESEDVELGSRVSASNSYGFWGTASKFWESSKGFFGWILSGLAGSVIISVFGGIIGILILYWIFRLGRSLF
jgi:hypothetical protein